MTLSLSTVYSVNRNFQRAKRLDTDLAINGLHGYNLNETAWQILKSFCQDISLSNQKAFTWTGPYGSGKSSLALLLSALLAPKKSEIRNAAIKILDRERAKFFNECIKVSETGWIVLRIIGSKSDPASIIHEELKRAWTTRWGQKSLSKFLDEEKTYTKIKQVVLLIDEMARKSSDEGDGLLIIVDEMGKFLEFSAQDDGDLFIFQEIAELVSRNKNQCAFLGILHQSFDEYSRKNSREARAEWSKIQGRFSDTPFSIAIEEIVSLISNAIEGPDNRKNLTLCKNVARALTTGRMSHLKSLPDILAKCIPLHPVTALLLGPISRRRFGQNERSVFSFLSSGEPKSFYEFLETEISTSKNLYTLDLLWDYLSFNHEPAILASPDGAKWSEASEAINRVTRKEDTSDIHISAIKTIAVLDLFGTQYGIGATDKILALSLDVTEPELFNILNNLKSWSAIIARRHIGGWGIFSGSDIDLESELQKSKEIIKDDLDQIVRCFPYLAPVVAKRHYAEKGTLRIFERSIIKHSDLNKFITKSGNLSGKFLLVIGSSNEEQLELKDDRSWIAQDDTTLISFVDNENPLIESALTIAALQRIKATLPELEGDPAARRELSAKMNYSNNEIADRLNDAFISARWVWTSKQDIDFNGKSLSEISSEVCDEVFHSSPIIVNELLNRDKPSAQANAAKRRLALAMIGSANRPRLAIEGEPAEFGLYLSILVLSGIHREENDEWAFRDPDNKSFVPMWTAAIDFLSSETKRVDLSTFYELWHSKPYGVKFGVIPILTLAFILANTKSIAIYLDGNFVLNLDDLFIDRMFQAPEAVSVRWIEQNEVSNQALEQLAKFVVEQKIGEFGTTALEVTKPLVRFALKLPGWTRRTKQLSSTAFEVRELLLSARDPHALLFDDLPRVMNPSTALETKANRRNTKQLDLSILRNALNELRAKQDEMFASFKEQLEAGLNVDFSNKQSLQELSNRAMKVSISNSAEHDLRIKRFSDIVARIIENEDWLSDICGIAAAKPLKDWADPDRSRAILELNDLIEKFGQIEATISANDEKDVDISREADRFVKELENRKYNSVKKRAIFLLALKKLGSGNLG